MADYKRRMLEMTQVGVRYRAHKRPMAQGERYKTKDAGAKKTCWNLTPW